jgi:very-short-patch-repair endonuclease/DNA-directed RNA polymerase subunit RPC12/RpoP
MSKYKCWHCGQEHERVYEPENRVFCDECFTEYRREHKGIVEEYGRVKVLVMHETALRLMEKAGVYMHEYQDAAKKVLDRAVSASESFFSSIEMIVAIILSEFGYEYQPNYQIGKYAVDFLIPELKVCVEVDGHLHKGREIFDSNRDIEIRQVLGPEWEIVRLPTKYITKNPPKVPDAIEAILNKKKSLRKENHGVLPDWWSMREKKHYEKILGYEYKRVRKI